MIAQEPHASVHLVSGPAQQRSIGGIGASQGAAAIGVSEYRTPVDEWLVCTGRAEPFKGNEKTEWGHTLEPVIRAKYVERNGVAVYVPPESMWHPDIPWLKATPDGIVLDAGGKSLFVGPQVKNVGLRMAPAWADGVPTDYLIQGVIEMAVTNLPRIDFAVLIGGQEYREFTIWRDGELEAETIEGLAAFWELVESDTQPAIDDSKAFKSYLLRQLKKRVTIAASVTDLVKLARWREVAREIKTLEREEKRIKNEVLAVLAAGDAGRMTSDLGPITVGSPKRKTAWKGVAEALSPLLITMQVIERELAGLRADAADTADLGGTELVHRIDGLRAQLCLVGELNNFEALVAANTATGEPSVNRPQNWTKGLGTDADESED